MVSRLGDVAFAAKFGWFFSPTVSDFQGNLTEKNINH